MTRRLLPVAIGLAALAVMAIPLVLTMGSERGSAAFGDSERIGANRLSSATVDIESGERTLTMVGTNLAPGDRLTGSIEVRNVGSLPLRYAIVSDLSDDPLAQWLGWTIWPGDGRTGCGADRIGAEPLIRDRTLGTTDADSVSRIALVGDPLVGLDPGDRIIQPGSTDVLCTRVTLSLEAPDSVQARRVVQELVVVAEQQTDGSVEEKP